MATTVKTSAIAQTYWRQIKKGNKTYEGVPDVKKSEVLMLARADVKDGVITAEEFEQLIGIPYVPDEAEKTTEPTA